MRGRVLLRFSIDGERDGALRTAVTRVLESGGFLRERTGTVELGVEQPVEIPADRLLQALEMLLKSNPEAMPGEPSLDHIWLYVDKGL
ncbi:MAG: hypothetical protein ABI743_14955 [bacterium]